MEGKEFCEYTPFMFAFVLLIIKWVRSENNNPSMFCPESCFSKVMIALVPVFVCCCAPLLLCLGLASSGTGDPEKSYQTVATS